MYRRTYSRMTDRMYIDRMTEEHIAEWQTECTEEYML